MKILIAANHYPVASGRYMADAFRRLGHEVRTAGPAMGNNIWGITVDPKYIWTPDTDYMRDDWPDLVLVIDTDRAVWEEVRSRHFQCPIAIYTVDNHVRDVEFPLFDHYFLAHYHGPAYPVDPARADHTWLPCASDPMFTPSPIPWEQREFDVCMVGVGYPRRVEVVNALKDAGLKVFSATGLLYEDYRNVYWNSRISLCVSAAGDVAQRIFETGRMGCAILTDPLLDLDDPLSNKLINLRGYAKFETTQLAVDIAQEMIRGDFAIELMQGGVVFPPKGAIPHGDVGIASAVNMAQSCWSHTWDARAQVIVDWFEKRKDSGVSDIRVPAEAVKVATPADIEAMRHPTIELNGEPKVYAVEPKRKPFLNLGCGTTHFPSERPPGHEFIDASIYQQPLWLNVDKVEGVGADKVFDLFAYPWSLESNSFDGAVLGHIAEHIPHEIKLSRFDDPQRQWMPTQEMIKRLAELQDGWYAFFAELYRVLTPGAVAHIISPFAWSDGAIVDPTHTRLLTPQSYLHGLSPEQYSGTFKYNVDCNFEVVSSVYRYSPLAEPYKDDPTYLNNAVMTRINMIYDFYVQLKAVK